MLQNQPKIINNKKALLFSRAFLRKSAGSAKLSPELLSERNLLRYFPKYIHKLAIGTKTGPTISKVKRIRILHVFQGDQSQNQSQNLRRTLLYNKEKHIQSFYDGDKLDPEDFIREIKAFAGLKSLKTLSKSHSSFALRKICQYIRYFYKLEHLEVQIDSKMSMSAISEIDSYKRLLDSLRTLKIDCRWRFKWNEDPEDNINLFRALVENKNILKSTTSLKLGPLKDQAFYELFEKTLASCPKLGSLMFGTDNLRPDDDSWENPGLKAEDYKPIDYQYLQALGSLHHLHTVSISCNNMSTLVRDFTLPPSIQNAKLRLPSFEPSMFLKQRWNNKDVPEIFLDFCEKWSCLPNLKTLALGVSQLRDDWGTTVIFLQSWLKWIHNIQELEIELSSEDPSPFHWGQNLRQGNFDLSGSLESIQHFKGTLRTLVISDNGKIYSIENLPKEPFGFNCLDKFSLQGFIPQEELDISRLFQVNFQDVLATKFRKPFELVVEGISIDSLGSFVNFMKSFDHEGGDEKRFVKMKMTVYVRTTTSQTYRSDRFSHYLTFQARNLSIEMKVVTNAKLGLGHDPRVLLGNNLSFLKLQD